MLPKKKTKKILFLIIKNKILLNLIIFIIDHFHYPKYNPFPLRILWLNTSKHLDFFLNSEDPRKRHEGYKVFLEKDYIFFFKYKEKNILLKNLSLFDCEQKKFNFLLSELKRNIKIRKSIFIFWIYSISLPIIFFLFFCYIDNLMGW